MAPSEAKAPAAEPFRFRGAREEGPLYFALPSELLAQACTPFAEQRSERATLAAALEFAADELVLVWLGLEKDAVRCHVLQGIEGRLRVLASVIDRLEVGPKAVKS